MRMHYSQPVLPYPTDICDVGYTGGDLVSLIQCGPFGAVDLVSGVRLTNTNGGVVKAEMGRGVACVTTGTQQWEANALSRNPLVTDKISCLAVAYTTNSAASRKRIVRWRGSAGTLAQIEFGDGGTAHIFGGVQVSGATFPVARGPTFDANRIYAVAFSYDTNVGTHPANFSMSVDGSRVSTVGGAPSTNNLASTITGLELGNNATSFPLLGGVFLAALFVSRVQKTAEELNEMTARPFDLLRSKSARTYFIPEAAAPSGFQAAWARNANTVIQAVA